MTIRKAKKTELSQLQDLNNEVFIDNAKYDPDIVLDWCYSDVGVKYYKELLSNPKKLCLIAETDQGKFVGYLSSAPKEIDFRKSKYFEIENMGVIPEYRSQGIGKKLIDECKKWAKKNGYQRLFVISYYNNEGAVRFYKKSGFGEIDVSLEVDI